MIDESKYEGHTPANLWGREIVAEGKRKIFLNTAWLSSIGNDVYSNEIDRKLMADAPLLLEEVKRLQKYSNVLENLMGLLDSSDEGDWILLETIDELMKEEGIARWSQEKDKTETNLI